MAHILARLAEVAPDVLIKILELVAAQDPTRLLSLGQTDRATAAALRSDRAKPVWERAWRRFLDTTKRVIPDPPATASDRDRLRLAACLGCMLCGEAKRVRTVFWQYGFRACAPCLRKASVTHYDLRGAYYVNTDLLEGLPSHTVDIYCGYSWVHKHYDETCHLTRDVEARLGTTLHAMMLSAGARRAERDARRAADRDAEKIRLSQAKAMKALGLKQEWASKTREERLATRRLTAVRMCAAKDPSLTAERLAGTAAFERLVAAGGARNDATAGGVARALDAILDQTGVREQRAREAFEAEASAASTRVAEDVMRKAVQRQLQSEAAVRERELVRALAAVGLNRRRDSSLCDAFVAGRERARTAADVAVVMARFHYLYGGFCEPFSRVVRETIADIEETVLRLAGESTDDEGMDEGDGDHPTGFYPGIYADACQEVLGEHGIHNIAAAKRHIAESWTMPESWPWMKT
jgi:hypothetical protein